MYFACGKNINFGEPDGRLIWVELCPSPKRYVKFFISTTSQCDLMCKQRYCRQGHRVGGPLIQYDWCLYKISMWRQKNLQGEWHVMTKAEIGVIQLHAKEYRRLSANHQKLGRGMERFSYRFQRKPTPWLQTFSLHNCEAINFCCLKLPRVWYFRKWIQIVFREIEQGWKTEKLTQS